MKHNSIPAAHRRPIHIACPVCGRTKFTPRTLRSHFCPAKVAMPGHIGAPLTKDELQSAIVEAQEVA